MQWFFFQLWHLFKSHFWCIVYLEQIILCKFTVWWEEKITGNQIHIFIFVYMRRLHFVEVLSHFNCMLYHPGVPLEIVVIQCCMLVTRRSKILDQVLNLLHSVWIVTSCLVELCGIFLFFVNSENGYSYVKYFYWWFTCSNYTIANIVVEIAVMMKRIW